jgi:hydrogenase-4 component F
MILAAIVVVPFAVSLLSLFLPRQVTEVITIVSGVISFVGALLLLPATAHKTVTAPPFLRADALSEVFLLATTFLYAIISIYTIGYFARERHDSRHSGAAALLFNRYSRRFYVGLNLFAWSMICAPLVNGLAFLWIAIEITTVVSALLVAIDNTDGATEAAWKYVLIASSGLGIALLATIVLYYAGSQTLGTSYDLEFDPLLAAARHLPKIPVELAFGLAVVGFGTKVGLFPVHTWLPDAHSEAPTPISALLSGALLATSFYAILRFYQIAVGTVGPTFPQTVLLVFGVLSLLLAALYLFGQKNIKRMLAYSSVEHMGILAIGVSFGVPIAFVGVLLHVLAHAAGKGTAFMGAGVFVHKFGTKDIDRIRGAINVLPWSAPLFLIAVVALGATPPFGIFRSEFLIVAGGLSNGKSIFGAIFLILVTLAFFGLSVTTTRILFLPQAKDAAVARGEPSVWMVVPVVLGVGALLLLGIYPPEVLMSLLNHGAAELQGSR